MCCAIVCVVGLLRDVCCVAFGCLCLLRVLLFGLCTLWLRVCSWLWFVVCCVCGVCMRVFMCVFVDMLDTGFVGSLCCCCVCLCFVGVACVFVCVLA